MRNSLIGSTFPKYCGRIIAATLASTLSSFVDGCIVGKQLGAEDMAAFGIAMPFILILIVVPGIILSSGGSICASRLLGENKPDRAGSSFTVCCLAGASVGVFGAAMCLLFPAQIVSVAGATGNVAAGAAAYMRGYSPGAVPTLLLSVLMYYANLDGNENLSLIAVTLMTVVDIALDLLLGVKLGMGMTGMALATSISYLCAVVFFLVFYLRGRSSFRFRFAGLIPELVDILKNGYPSALNTLLVSARCFLLNRILISIAGQAAVTAFSFQSNFNQFFVAIASGISTTVSALTGIFIGERDRQKVDASVRAGFRLGIILTVLLAAVLLIGAPLLTDLLMTGTETEKQYSVNALRLFSLSMPFSVICIVFISFYQTMGNRKLANCIAAGHGLVFIIAGALLLPKVLGLNGVWLSTLFGELLMLLVLGIYTGISKHCLPGTMEDMILIDGRLFPKVGTVLTCSGSVSDAGWPGQVKKELQNFLKVRGFTEAVISACADFIDMPAELMQDTEPGNSGAAVYWDLQAYTDTPEDAAVPVGADSAADSAMAVPVGAGSLADSAADVPVGAGSLADSATCSAGTLRKKKAGQTKTERQAKSEGRAKSEGQAKTEGQTALFINIRFTGKTIYDRLAAEAGRDTEQKLAGAGLRLYSRFGAEISFINIRSE